jgi:tetratricopeptide (TPR) repeat protein
VEAHLALAALYAEGAALAAPAEAERALRRAVQVRPAHARALTELARLLEEEYQDTDAAEDLYRRAIRADPRDPRPLCRYAALLASERGDHALAGQLLSRALQIDPTIPGAAAFRRLLDARRLAPGAPAAAPRADEAGEEELSELASWFQARPLLGALACPWSRS